MINSVAIQRLLEAATMLKLERGLRAAGSQPGPTNSAATNSARPQQPVSASFPSPFTARDVLPTTRWTNPPILTPDGTADLAAAVIATTPREAAPAPVAYRDSIADAGAQARLPEQSAGLTAAIPAPVQYANSELALALSVKATRVAAGSHKAFGIDGADPGRGQKSEEEMAAQQRLIFAGAIGGAIVVTVAIFFAVSI